MPDEIHYVGDLLGPEYTHFMFVSSMEDHIRIEPIRSIGKVVTRDEYEDGMRQFGYTDTYDYFGDILIARDEEERHPDAQGVYVFGSESGLYEVYTILETIKSAFKISLYDLVKNAVIIKTSL